MTINHEEMRARLMEQMEAELNEPGKINTLINFDEIVKELEGTEKQVRWANDIREDALYSVKKLEIEEMVSYAKRFINEIINDEPLMNHKKIWATVEDITEENIIRTIVEIFSENSAAVWIENGKHGYRVMDEIFWALVANVEKNYLNNKGIETESKTGTPLRVAVNPHIPNLYKIIVRHPKLGDMETQGMYNDKKEGVLCRLEKINSKNDVCVKIKR